MTILTKAIGGEKTVTAASDKMEQPLVVEENPKDESKIDLESQTTKRKCIGHYLILENRVLRPNAMTALCLAAMLVVSIGMISGVFIYRQYGRAQMHRLRTGWYSIPYDNSIKLPYAHNQIPLTLLTHHDEYPEMPNLDDILKEQHEVMQAANSFRSIEYPVKGFFKERFEIDLENGDYEKIDVPDFRGGRQGRFIHDFYNNKTGIIDIDRRCCFVMPLNRQRVLPPINMFDLLNKMYHGYYDVNTEVVQETMRVVTPPITDMSSVGPYISQECQDLPTYMLEKVNNSNVFKRSASGGMFGQFAGRNILELNILNLEDVLPSDGQKLEGKK
ncbi:uncharacterized protein LOC105703380 [Orussus abietinus]|uniref:uncharacterized protein LOC105703380 n=1 Tax=Orussus abietinus TaxID=222816 RepID=UPI000626C7EF|nr:uncharacterized protein LOC105703380 [Orussus abietinus]